MSATFRVTLDFIGPEAQGLRFRVAFDASPSRWLLPYPAITGLRFIPVRGGEAPEWTTRYLVTEPRDEFVLKPVDRIALGRHCGFSRQTDTPACTVLALAGRSW